MGFVKSFAFIISWEMILLLTALTIMGVFAQPLPTIVAFADSLGITIYELATDLFIVGSIIGVIVMCLIAVAGGRPWK